MRISDMDVYALPDYKNHIKPNPYNTKRFEAQMYSKLERFITDIITHDRPVYLTEFVKSGNDTEQTVCHRYIQSLIFTNYSRKEVRNEEKLYSPKELRKIEISSKHIEISNYDYWQGWGHESTTIYHISILVNGWFVATLSDENLCRLLCIIRGISIKYGLGDYEPLDSDIDQAFQESDHEWLVMMCKVGNIEMARFIFDVFNSAEYSEDVEAKTKCIRALSERGDFDISGDLEL